MLILKYPKWLIQQTASIHDVLSISAETLGKCKYEILKPKYLRFHIKKETVTQ